MKLKHTAALAALALGLTAVSAHADGSLNAFFAGRVLKNDAFLDPVDHPGSIGVMADIGLGPTLPLFLSVSGIYSSDDDMGSGLNNDTKLEMGELGLGLKLMPQSGMVRPYVGGGTLRNWVQVERKSGAQSDSDTSKGWYMDAGAALWISRHFDVGANIRWVTDTDLSLYGARGDVDARIFSVFAGCTWGERSRRRHRERHD